MRETWPGPEDLPDSTREPWEYWQQQQEDNLRRAIGSILFDWIEERMREDSEK